MKTKLTKLNQGFTIIEVMIVLAIAGLILAIIFLAVPALQRNSRNTQRNSDGTHLGGLVETYIADNSGTQPTQIIDSNTPAVPVANTVYIGGDTFTAQATGAPFVSGATTAITVAPGGGVSSPPALGTDAVYSKAACSGQTVTGGGTGMVVFYGLEVSGGTLPHCLTV